MSKYGIMDTILLYVICFLLLALIAVVSFMWRKTADSGSPEIGEDLQRLKDAFARFEINLKEDFRINREENSLIAKDNRAEVSNTLKGFKEELATVLRGVSETGANASKELDNRLTQKVDALITKTEEASKATRENINSSIKEFILELRGKFDELKREQKEAIREMTGATEKRLDEIRITVDEKLQKTLSERLGQSFDIVGKQLESVQKGLGEMQTIASDVGGLKKVLSNVRLRGGVGEVQLAMLLEQILAPTQYDANVRTKAGSTEPVEFAIKLPDKSADEAGFVYLPIDAKFPKDTYEQVLSAYENGNIDEIDVATKNLESAIKKMAKDIRDKYIDPPNTTDFAIMFLPFESIFAEVIRRTALVDQLRDTYKVTVAGPTTLAALLNSLQMGFRTLALQKRSSEVWTILGAVKTEFDKFGGMLEKAQKNLHSASETVDELLGKRTRAISRKLKNVESLPAAEAQALLPEIGLNVSEDEGD